MAVIHISLQAKGGVGKSFLALMLSMFYRHIQKPVKIFDTDPANATLFGFPALEAEKFEIMKKDDIDKRLFDRLFSQILSATDDVIIDVGANAFIPLCSYIISNNLITMLTQEGHQVIIHTSIVGGQNLKHTVNGFDALCSQFPESTGFVIWLNPFWGEIEFEGKSFEKLKVYEKHKSRIRSIIKIPEWDVSLHGRDLAAMLEKQKTFDEALASEDFSIFERQRLNIIKNEMFQTIETAQIV
jgi:hypothetical protein